MPLLPLATPPEIRYCGQGVHQPTGLDRFESGDHWWLHAYTYAAALRVGDEEIALRPGSVTLVPPGSVAVYRFPPDALHICAHFLLDDGIPGQPVPTHRRLGTSFAGFFTRFAEAVSWTPRRQAARVWDLLWEYATGEPEAAGSVVARAASLIDRELADLPPVGEIARRCGCSHNTLLRAFRRETGTTVVGWIRHRRADRALFLLCNSRIPVARVAAQVGAGDLQRLNRLLRQVHGVSPRRVRTGPCADR